MIFDFSSVLPTLTIEEKDYLENLEYKSETYKDSGIHPTTEVFFT